MNLDQELRQHCTQQLHDLEHWLRHEQKTKPECTEFEHELYDLL